VPRPPALGRSGLQTARLPVRVLRPAATRAPGTARGHFSALPRSTLPREPRQQCHPQRRPRDLTVTRASRPVCAPEGPAPACWERGLENRAPPAPHGRQSPSWCVSRATSEAPPLAVPSASPNVDHDRRAAPPRSRTTHPRGAPIDPWSRVHSLRTRERDCIPSLTGHDRQTNAPSALLARAPTCGALALSTCPAWGNRRRRTPRARHDAATDFRPDPAVSDDKTSSRSVPRGTEVSSDIDQHPDSSRTWKRRRPRAPRPRPLNSVTRLR
jgi:hypothetical protein